MSLNKVGQDQYSPSRSYEIELTIKDRSLSNDLRQVRVVTSLNSAYQILSLDLSLDPNDIILENIYGKDPLKLQIKLKGHGSKIPIEHVNFDLMYLDSESTIPMKKSSSEGSSVDRTRISFTAVPREPFKAMTTIVNNVYIGKTLHEIISDLVSKTNCKLVMDTDDQNTDRIDQVIIPPTSLYKAIRYLDDNFGIYNSGSSNLGFCQFDNNFYIMNLTKRMDKAQAFTVYHLSTDASDANKIISKSTDGKNFYIYNALYNSYEGNLKFAVLAKTSNIILKPKDSLYSNKKYDLLDICSNYGIIDKNTNIDFDPKLDNRETYITTNTGYDSNLVSVSWLARQIAGLSTISFMLEKDLPLLSLINIGQAVKLVTKTAEYTPLSGKYIFKSSDFLFRRDAADWKATVAINLMRTNKTI
jgi:hypothetical protein